MTTGTVADRHATAPVTFRLPAQPNLTLEFVVDTGFIGFLTLPEAAVIALALPHLFDTPANLADDSEVQLPVHGAVVLWNGEEIAVRVLATGRRPLLGMALLEGQELVIQCVDGGLVTIDEM